MQIKVWVKTDKGLKRESNQDAFLVNPDLGLYIVADGMGGHSGGEVASSLAVKTMQEFISEKKAQYNSPVDLLSHAYAEASRVVYDHAHLKSPDLIGMGTTMVAMLIAKTTLYIGNIGDSRAYLFRKPHIWQLTEDHSLANEQLRAGIIDEEQYKNFVGKNLITRSVGYEREVIPDVIEREIVPGDQILICSDGLSGLVNDNDLASILRQTSPEKVVDACIDRALSQGGHDNVTVLFMST